MAGNHQHSGTHTTRLAPSPTGALHLGNVRTFLINWALARQNNWRILLRIEDLDGPRIKPGAAQSCIDLLTWLGIDWDDGPVIQSDDLEPYVDAMRKLAAMGKAYPCALSRSQIAQAASAPHPHETHETVFPPSLRPAGFQPGTPIPFEDRGTNWRLAVADEPICFTDCFAGVQKRNLATSIGDFVIWTQRAQPSYQLAVVVDDLRQHITQVVRGDDLLDSAARQLALYACLDATHIPAWTHLPLVLGPDGKRLAKRHGDTRLTTYKAQGCSPERIIGLIACWCGMIDAPEPMNAQAFCKGFSLDTLPRIPVIFTKENDRWLRP